MTRLQSCCWFDLYCFINFFLGYFVFFAIVLYEISKGEQRNMTQEGCPLDITERVIFLIVIGHALCTIERMILLERGRFFVDRWNVYCALNTLLFFISFAVWSGGTVYHEKTALIDEDRDTCGSQKSQEADLDDNDGLWPSTSYLNSVATSENQHLRNRRFGIEFKDQRQ